VPLLSLLSLFSLFSLFSLSSLSLSLSLSLSSWQDAEIGDDPIDDDVHAVIEELYADGEPDADEIEQVLALAGRQGLVATSSTTEADTENVDEEEDEVEEESSGGETYEEDAEEDEKMKTVETEKSPGTQHQSARQFREPAMLRRVGKILVRCQLDAQRG